MMINQKIMSATEARITFGRVIREVSEEDTTIDVERNGSPTVAFISLERLARYRQSAVEPLDPNDDQNETQPGPTAAGAR